MRVDRRLTGALGRARPLLALTISLGVFGAALLVLQALLLSHMVDHAFLHGAPLASLRQELAGWLLLTLLRVPTRTLREEMGQRAANSLKRTLRERLHEALLQRGPAALTGERSGELLAVMGEGMNALDDYTGGYLPQLALAGLTPLLMLLFLLPIDLTSSLVLLVTAPLIPLFMVLVGDNAERMTHSRWRSLGHLGAVMLDSLQGMATLKVLGASGRQRERIADVARTFRSSTLDVLRVTFLSALVLEWTAMLGTAVVAVEIALRLLAGRLYFQPAFFVLLLAPQFYLPLRTLGARFHAGMAGLAAADRIFEFTSQPSPDPAPPHAGVSFKHNLSLEEVRYEHPGRSEAGLADVSLTLAAGESLAIMGSSGSGKSTLVSLLLRFLEPQQGRILVDGRPLADCPAAAWRALVAWVPQLPHLFDASAFDNIRLARPDASFEAVEAAARAAGIHTDLCAMPGGYGTQIGEGGTRLSAGQRQRVAIARAFLKDAPILILDEATASLDPLSEQAVLRDLAALMQGRTTLFITHSLPAARTCQRVAVLQAGRVIEDGTHHTLLADQGIYANLVHAYGGAA